MGLAYNEIKSHKEQFYRGLTLGRNFLSLQALCGTLSNFWLLCQLKHVLALALHYSCLVAFFKIRATVSQKRMTWIRPHHVFSFNSWCSKKIDTIKF